MSERFCILQGCALPLNHDGDHVLGTRDSFLSDTLTEPNEQSRYGPELLRAATGADVVSVHPNLFSDLADQWERDRNEIETLRGRVEWLTGKWEQANERCPQCGNGLRGSPFVAGLESEVNRLREGLQRIADEGAEPWAGQLARDLLEGNS